MLQEKRKIQEEILEIKIEQLQIQALTIVEPKLLEELVDKTVTAIIIQETVFQSIVDAVQMPILLDLCLAEINDQFMERNDMYTLEYDNLQEPTDSNFFDIKEEQS